MSRSYEWKQFDNIGCILYKFTDEELAPLRKEVADIQADFTKAETWNHQLAGHIKHEYAIIKSKDYVEKLIKPLAKHFSDQFKYYSDFNIMSKKMTERKLILDNLWVNYQKKHEFNPIHSHHGVLSFVIWLQMPFTFESESNYFKTTIKSDNQRTSTFNFYYTNSLGDIMNTPIPADKTYENTICIFPARMKHAVYPFYTSDDYRISVSGNFHIDPMQS